MWSACMIVKSTKKRSKKGLTMVLTSLRATVTRSTTSKIIWASYQSVLWLFLARLNRSLFLVCRFTNFSKERFLSWHCRYYGNKPSRQNILFFNAKILLKCRPRNESLPNLAEIPIYYIPNHVLWPNLAKLTLYFWRCRLSAGWANCSVSLSVCKYNCTLYTVQ